MGPDRGFGNGAVVIALEISLNFAPASDLQTACRACHSLPITSFFRSLLSSSAALALTVVPSHSRRGTTGLCLCRGSKET
jgi:hypothetical protein